jgi:hypothetical protein
MKTQGRPADTGRVVRYAFAPVHKAALGVAVGLTSGVLTAVATVAQLVLSPGDGMPLSLLAEYFSGYTVSWSGVAIGFGWAFVVGFVAGWFLAFLKNLLTALWLFGVRVNSALTQPFLDHI